IELLKNKVIFEKKYLNGGNSDILYVPAYLLGEFRNTIDIENVEDILFNLTSNEVKELSDVVQNSYIIAILKIYIYWLLKLNFTESSTDAYKQITTMLMDKLQLFMGNSDIEVQDRANLVLEILNKIYEQYDPVNDKDKELIKSIDSLFDGELKPVAAKAQKMVPVPEGLDLDKVINEESQEMLNEIDTSFADESKYFWMSRVINHKPRKELSKREMEEARRKRKQSKKDNPFYLDFDEDEKSQNSFYEPDIDSIPVVQFTYDFDEKLVINPASENEPENNFVFLEDEEIPEGAIEIKEDDDKDEEEKVLKNLDLTKYDDMAIAISATEAKKKKKSKKSSSKKGKKPADDDDETKTKKKKKGTKKTKKKLPKPVVGEKTITITNNQSNLVEMNPVSIQTSLSTKSEFASVQLEGKILSMIYKWEFTNEPNVIRVQFLIKNNIEKDKVKIIKFEIAETMKAHIVNINNNLPLTVSPNQAVTIEKEINLLSSSLIMNITLPSSIQYQDLSVDPKNYQESFKLSLPLTIYMKRPSFPITSEHFVEIISDPNKINQNAIVKVTLPSNISQDEIQSIVRYTSEDLLKLHVVEVVNGAATLVGESVQGNIIAALLKQSIRKNNDIVISLNIKGDNDELVNGLADIAHTIKDSDF
ncbi:hypothetical protein PIROE2DRAFT_3170, partial [Piromyces sp. E2]